MKTLKQIQEENRKFIIMANNRTAKTHKEALKRELDFGCIIYDILGAISNTQAECNYHKIICSSNGIMFTVKSLDGYNSFDDVCLENLLCKDYFKIIGKPLTLDRVLLSICEIYSKIEHSPLVNIIYIYDCYGKNKIKWDLTKKTLEEQSEETQRKFNKLINEI